MKIAFISSWNEKCGIAGYTSDLITSLSRSGFDSQAFRPPIEIMRDENTPTHLKIKEIIKFAKSLPNFDIIHIQHEFSFFGKSELESNLVLRGLIKNLPKKSRIFVTLHTINQGGIKLKTLLSNNFRNLKQYTKETINNSIWRSIIRSRKITIITHNQRGANILAMIGIPKTDILTIPLGSNPPPKHKISQLEAKQKLGYNDNDILIATFGFIADYKGGAISAWAVNLLPDNFKLAVVGGRHPSNTTDNTIENILSIASNASNNNKIRVTGFLEGDQVDLYRIACDIIVAPYKEVGLSSSAAITWAISSNKPIIASNIKAFSEINSKYQCLFIVGQNAPHELAWAINNVTNNDHLKNNLTRGGHLYYKEHSWDYIAINYYSHIYQKTPT